MRILAVAIISFVLVACGGEAEQAQRHDLEVVTDGSALESVETDEGYQVEVESVTLRVRSVEFTAGGEAHASRGLERIAALLIRRAHAHPNHQAGGEVVGELPGPLLLTWRPGQSEVAGTGRFLEAEYQGYNLEFSGDPIDEDDPLEEGLMARIEGSFDDGGGEVPFVADIEATDTAQIFGGVLRGNIPDDVDTAVALKLLTEDDWTEATLFDGVRFSQVDLDEAGVAQIDIDSEPVAHGMIRIALREHGFYDGKLQ